MSGLQDATCRPCVLVCQLLCCGCHARLDAPPLLRYPLSPAFPSCVPAPPPHVPPCSTLPCTRGIFRTSAIMGLGPRVGDAVFGFQEQSRILRRFRAGELNLLISTSGGRASEWVGGRAGGWAAGWLCGCPGHPEGSLTQLDV